ncbi:MAG: hypothetical protein IT260_03830, partial [Saprospiraceae bacterium]|nr:hypothetical protein [Saprospiraceae bacterium]
MSRVLPVLACWVFCLFANILSLRAAGFPVTLLTPSPTERLDCPLAVDAGADVSICGCHTAELNGSYTGATGNIFVNWTASPAAANAWISNATTLTPTITVPCTFSGTVTLTLTVQSVNPTCSASDVLILTVLPAPTVGVYNIVQATCTQGGAFSATAGGGTGPYTLQWSNGYVGYNPTDLAPGQYYVTVTNAEGCFLIGSFPIAGPAPLHPTVNNPSICGGGSSSVVLTVGGGNFTNYSWSSGQSGNPISVSSPGDYTVTVTAANGCTATVEATVSVQPEPMPELNMPQLCPGSTATLTVSGGPFTLINWSNGQHNSSITVSAGGTYSVTVTDANGCTAMATQTIALLPSPMPVIVGPPAACVAEMTTLTVSGGNFTLMNWSNGETGSTTTVPGSGTYSVTVTDDNGCTGTDAHTIAPLPSPVPVITGPTAMCTGAQAALALSSTFTAYEWSGGQTNNSISISAPGTYTVTVTNVNGCTGIDAHTVVALPNPVPVITGPPAICVGGTATLAVSGGNFTAINWSSGQSSTTISVFSAETYSVTVTAVNGCTATDDFVLSNYPSPMPVLNGVEWLCPGEVEILSVSGGNFTAVSWTGGLAGSILVVDMPGTYTVTVTDNHGCTGTAVQTLTGLPAPAPVLQAPGSACAGIPVTLTVGGGSFSNLSWSTGQSGNSITVVPPGTYSVTVTDANGCTGTDYRTVSTLPAPQPGITGSASICVGQTDTLMAGSGFAAYQWSTGVSGPSLVTALPGTFTVTVTAANGCTGTAMFQVTAASAVPANAGPDQTLCPGQSASLLATGGSNFLWNTGQTSASVVVSPDTATAYSVLVSAPGACSTTDTVWVFPLPGSSGVLQALVCPGDSLLVGDSLFHAAHPNGVVVLTGAHGCDSILTVSLGFYPVSVQQQQFFTCNPSLAGVVTQVWPSQFGCDSTVVSTTVFDPQLRDTTAIQQTTCDPALAGVAVAVLTGADGCDSVLVTTTVLQPSPVVFIEKITCDPALAGIVTQVWPSQFGCDSTVLTTTVFDTQLRDTTAIQLMTCDPALAGVAVAVLTGTDGCDSVLVTTMVLQPSPIVFIEKITCNPALAGIVTHVWPSQFGCDSTVLSTTVFDPQ